MYKKCNDTSTHKTAVYLIMHQHINQNELDNPDSLSVFINSVMIKRY